jgi:Uma2 family endonuclease
LTLLALFREEVVVKPVPPRVAPGPIVYPESDGQPIAENTKQFGWIILLYNNLSGLFCLRPDVFVAADLFWYPVEGHPEIRTAPDGLVVFGRPKGDRGSYRQWQEDNIPLTVAFEVLGPSMTAEVQACKRVFYGRHGVEEYYIYDPDNNRLQAYVRRGEVLARVRKVEGFVSPRLGIRFDLSGPEMVVFRPDGQRFLTFEELQAAKDQLQAAMDQAEQRALRLATLSRKARQGQASPDELRELERLEEETLARPPAPEQPS